MPTRCGIEIEECLGKSESERQYKYTKNTAINHKKDVKNTLTVGGYDIPIRTRKRTFAMTVKDADTRSDFVVIIDTQYYEHECYDLQRSPDFSVSENSEFIDSTVYIVDTDNKNAFWREDTYKCVFAGSSSDYTYFHHPSWEAHKLRINKVDYEITREWKLMLNGTIEILLTENQTKSMYSSEHPLFFVWPMPMSGESTDPDFIEYPKGKGFSFLDYRTGGLGPSEAEKRSGGMDYYYPEYLWYMGTYREEDGADAYTRFEDTYGSITNLKEVTKRAKMVPLLRGYEPRGSITRDYAGNTFASVRVTKLDGTHLHFNRLKDSEGKDVSIPEAILPGENISYFPIGVI